MPREESRSKTQSVDLQDAIFELIYRAEQGLQVPVTLRTPLLDWALPQSVSWDSKCFTRIEACIEACKVQQMTSVLAENPVLLLSDLHIEFTGEVQEPRLCKELSEHLG